MYPDILSAIISAKLLVFSSRQMDAFTNGWHLMVFVNLGLSKFAKNEGKEHADCKL